MVVRERRHIVGHRGVHVLDVGYVYFPPLCVGYMSRPCSGLPLIKARQ